MVNVQVVTHAGLAASNSWNVTQTCKGRMHAAA